MMFAEVKSEYTKTLKQLDFGYCFTMSNSNQDPASIIKLNGNINYLSRKAHQLQKPSNVDDLESVIYIAFHFLNGYLPWQNTKASTNEIRSQMVLDMKSAFWSERLYDQTLPRTFVEVADKISEMEAFKPTRDNMPRCKASSEAGGERFGHPSYQAIVNLLKGLTESETHVIEIKTFNNEIKGTEFNCPDNVRLFKQLPGFEYDTDLSIDESLKRSIPEFKIFEKN